MANINAQSQVNIPLFPNMNSSITVPTLIIILFYYYFFFCMLMWMPAAAGTSVHPTLPAKRLGFICSLLVLLKCPSSISVFLFLLSSSCCYAMKWFSILESKRFVQSGENVNESVDGIT